MALPRQLRRLLDHLRQRPRLGQRTGRQGRRSAPSEGSHVEHCLSYGNSSAGFDYNSGVEVVFVRNTAWDNNRGFYGGDDTRFEHNLASEGERAHGGNGVFDDNSWERSGEVTFLSTDPSSPDFLVPTPGGGFEDLGAHSMP